ncbi:MAG: MFS transporter [Chromatiales bacterium]|nr:MAG: MFS transporter [Chromatiales bacterium]
MSMFSRFMLMLTLVFAGEIVFLLPFHTTRFFRPTLLEAFELSNTQLGDFFAVYGLMAMISYFPGGALADRFSARGLLTASLITTSAGGLYMATYPGTVGLALLFGYWGVTTILLFWAALIRATREWGGHDEQGMAFGILEGGRGLVAASLASLGVVLLASLLPDNLDQLNNEERKAAFRSVIFFYSGVTLAAAALTWFVIPSVKHIGDSTRALFRNAVTVLGRPLVWAQAAVIICAYCGYKGVDNYSLYAVQVLGMNEVDGAKITAFATYVRPVAAIAAGLIADRWAAGKTVGACFVLLVISYGALAVSMPVGAGLYIIYGNLFVSVAAVFMLRGVYFALLEENQVPPYLTGAVAGTVSFIGYTPEIFFGPITGRILDANPGPVGHQHYFLFLAAVATIGVAVVVWLLRLQHQNTASCWADTTGKANQEI